MLIWNSQCRMVLVRWAYNNNNNHNNCSSSSTTSVPVSKHRRKFHRTPAMCTCLSKFGRNASLLRTVSISLQILLVGVHHRRHLRNSGYLLKRAYALRQIQPHHRQHRIESTTPLIRRQATSTGYVGTLRRQAASTGYDDTPSWHASKACQVDMIV